MRLAEGLLTRQGARTAHAAVVARQLGKVCLVGCETLVPNLAARSLALGEHPLAEGDWLTLDGHEGRVILGRAATRDVWREDLWQRRESLRQSVGRATGNGQ